MERLLEGALVCSEGLDQNAFKLMTLAEPLLLKARRHQVEARALTF